MNNRSKQYLHGFKKWGLLIFMTAFFISAQSQTPTMKTLQINSGWEFSQAGLDEWLPATVPGTVHTDLLANEKIEDPYYRTNERDLQWIDKVDWQYRTTFEVQNDLLDHDRLEMVFHGLDTYADVFVNDERVLEANNMFRTWRADVKKHLKAGQNRLKIVFLSPIKKGLAEMEAYGLRLPASNDQSENGDMGPNKVSIFTRKAGYHYGWDWGPRFVTSGIWRPIELQAWDVVRIDNVFLKQPDVSAKTANLVAQVNLMVNSPGSGHVIVENLTDGKEVARAEVTLQEGSRQIELPFTIRKPRLWWSNGLGEPNFYDFKVSVKAGSGKTASSQIRTGLRDIKLVREPDEKGESFYFELNGVKVFAKGANYIPNDLFLPRVSDEEYRKVISDAVDANMNMLRVWGGGIYENDIFYELCDENGIMVWQDFMFACSMYPGTEAFLDNVKQEAIDNVVRLRNHPSIALWCGNNENNTAWHYYGKGGWGWKERYSKDTAAMINDAYLEVFHEILPEVVAQYTAGDDYWPSSPQAGYEADQPASYETLDRGDQHYWGVWHGLHPFSDFEKYVGRFMSEFGFQSFPEFETVKKYTIPEDWDIESEVMAAHQRSGIGNLRIKEYMSWEYEVPDDFEQFLYMSQVLQARGMRIGVESHRRGMPWCMGSLYWQHNDCWPVASWSSTDYYRNWKAQHYAMRKAFEQVILSITQKEDKVLIYVVSDELKSFSGLVALEILDFNGKVIKTVERRVKVPVNNSAQMAELAVDELLVGHEPGQVVAHVRLLKGSNVVTDYLHYFSKPKDLQLLKPQIDVKVLEQAGEPVVEISANTLVKNLMLYVPGEMLHFSDNYFDVLPGKTYTVKVKTDMSPKDLQKKIETRHLLSE